eukprot:TRINITY_DN3370_c0_g2_i9.p2 TRINITY_DN3370_c0_g2~~TRINITY_DN3370_c0_g2_i9.p2  ORF type:complete len:123 (-),score=13.02 TRINITY_DN3370_c0_g2_i9:492-860(-)
MARSGGRRSRYGQEWGQGQEVGIWLGVGVGIERLVEQFAQLKFGQMIDQVSLNSVSCKGTEFSYLTILIIITVLRQDNNCGIEVKIFFCFDFIQYFAKLVAEKVLQQFNHLKSLNMQNTIQQ